MRGFSVKALPDTHPLFDMLEQIEHGKEVVVLTLTRRSGESLIIETPGGDHIEIKVTGVKRRLVGSGVVAPSGGMYSRVGIFRFSNRQTQFFFRIEDNQVVAPVLDPCRHPRQRGPEKLLSAGERR